MQSNYVDELLAELAAIAERAEQDAARETTEQDFEDAFRGERVDLTFAPRFMSFADAIDYFADYTQGR